MENSRLLIILMSFYLTWKIVSDTFSTTDFHFASLSKFKNKPNSLFFFKAKLLVQSVDHLAKMKLNACCFVSDPDLFPLRLNARRTYDGWGEGTQNTPPT